MVLFRPPRESELGVRATRREDAPSGAAEATFEEGTECVYVEEGSGFQKPTKRKASSFRNELLSQKEDVLTNEYPSSPEFNLRDLRESQISNLLRFGRKKNLLNHFLPPVIRLKLGLSPTLRTTTSSTRRRRRPRGRERSGPVSWKLPSPSPTPSS